MIGDEVLVPGNFEVTPVKVMSVSTVIKQGNLILRYHKSAAKFTQISR